MTGDDHTADSYECVDESMGDQIWMLDDPALSLERRARLEAHLSICDGCRLTVATVRRTAEGIQHGDLTLGKPWLSPLHLSPRNLGTAASLAMAASIACILLLPPPSTLDRLKVRGEDVARVVRPIADEVIWSETPRVSWTTIPGAERYRVTVQAVEGDYRWQQETAATAVRIGSERPLPARDRYRITVNPVPDYLAPGGPLASSFRRGSASEVAWFRATVAPLWTWLLGAAGLLMAAGSILRRR